MVNDSKDKKRTYTKRVGIVAIIIIALIATNAGSFYLGNLAAFRGYTPALKDKEVAASLQGVSDVSKFKSLFEVRDILYKNYDGPIDDQKLVEGAIKGMTEALEDPYTVFMDKKDYESFSEQSKGNYMGLGIQVEAKDDKIAVSTVFDNSPAKKAGILPGDFILKVNDTAVTGKELDKAVSMMKGTEKAEVKLTISREGRGTFDIKATRDVVKIDSVKGEMIDAKTGYIQIAGFEEATSNDFTKKLKELEDKGMKGLILDLRDNPGGYLDECVNVVSNFIPKGKTIVSTIDKYKNENKSESKGGIAVGMPLVVLVNGNSASASEITSGAIRDYKVGTLIGTTTFGKGVVQVVFSDDTPYKEKYMPSLEKGTALKVTISKYYTPNGENIHKKGIKPDIEVEYPKELLSKPYDRSKDPQYKKAFEVLQEKMK
ncbi:peptidase S41 [Clostridium zeae]|uniref:Peptidase S41 n=1 Tax=Clostridium zeae TaxID=2759022 RepID=A0ABQ1EFR8_9CLOT|nr:S41 family peptidase [Clostridium zeae]GFZ33668.1 peptidase S41 [Clostridium zeae]